MLKIENTEIVGLEAAIRGMRNPMRAIVDVVLHIVQLIAQIVLMSIKAVMPRTLILILDILLVQKISTL